MKNRLPKSGMASAKCQMPNQELVIGHWCLVIALLMVGILSAQTSSGSFVPAVAQQPSARVVEDQTPTPDTRSPNPNSPDSAYRLPPIVVVAARVQQRLSEVSLSTSRIPSDRFRLNPTDDAARVFDNEPGMDVRSYETQKGTSSLSIWGSTSQQVLVTVDGHPITNSFSGMSDLGLLMLNNSEEVEVARGPGSSLYGANALGGTVDFISESPLTHARDHIWQRIRASVSAPTSSDLGYFTGGRNGSLGFKAGLEQNSANGIRTNDQSRCFGAMATVGYYPLDGPTLDLTVIDVQRDLGLPGPRPDTSAIPRFGDSTASSVYDSERDNSTTVLGNLRWLPADNLTISEKPDWNLTGTRFSTLSPYAVTPDSIKQDNYVSQTLGNSLSADLGLGRYGDLVAGYDVRYEDGNVTSGVSDTSWNAQSLDHGLWAELLARLPGSLSANASARYDRSGDYGSALSPNVGIAWSFGGSDRLRANWGTAFRAPTFDDRYWPSSGVRDLKPEHGMTAQAGADIVIPTNILAADPSISITGFLRQTRDEIVWLPDSNGIWRPTNVDSSQHAGVEFATQLRPVTDLQVKLNATWVSGTQVNKELVYSNYMTGESRFDYVRRVSAFVPALSLGGQIDYALPTHTMLDVSARYRSARLNYYPVYNPDFTVTTETKRLSPYLVLDAAVSQTLFQHLSILVKLGNLLNTQYAEQFGNSLTDHDYPMPGRTFSIVLRYGTD